MSSVKDFRKQYQEAQMKKLQVLIEDLRRRFIELHTGVVVQKLANIIMILM